VILLFIVQGMPHWPGSRGQKYKEKRFGKYADFLTKDKDNG